LVPVKRR